MYDRILIATDGSPAMAAPLDHAIAQAELNGATLHALYVVDVRSYVMLPEETAERVAGLLHEAGEAAIEAVRERLESVAAVGEVVGAVGAGVPHEAILEYADEHDIDLIIVGTQGRTAEESRLLGSVAEAVVRRAEVPVLTVRMREGERLAPPDDAVPEEQQRYVG